MLSRLKRTLKRWTGEVGFELFYAYCFCEGEADGSCDIFGSGWLVSLVIYTDNKTWGSPADYDTTGPRQLFVRAVMTNDFGDIVETISGDTVHEVMDAIKERCLAIAKRNKKKLKSIKLVMSRRGAYYDERYW